MARRYMPLPTAARIRELLSYDANTGVLTWWVRRSNGLKPGSPAGTLANKRGYLEVTIDGVRYGNHRVAWKLMTGADPVDEIDHRDLDPGNNRWNNLRAATRGQNMANRHCFPRNEFGLKGVSPVRTKGKLTSFKAVVSTRGGGRHYLGCFKTPEASGSAVVFCSSWLLIRWHNRARCQAEIPLIAMSEIVEPLLAANPECHPSGHGSFPARTSVLGADGARNPDFA